MADREWNALHNIKGFIMLCLHEAANCKVDRAELGLHGAGDAGSNSRAPGRRVRVRQRAQGRQAAAALVPPRLGGRCHKVRATAAAEPFVEVALGHHAAQTSGCLSRTTPRVSFLGPDPDWTCCSRLRRHEVSTTT